MGSCCSKQEAPPARSPHPGPGILMPSEQAAAMADSAQKQLKKLLSLQEDRQRLLEEAIALQSEKAKKLQLAGKEQDMKQELIVAKMQKDNLAACRTNIFKAKERQEVLQQQRLDWLQHNTMVSVAPNFLQVDLDAASRANAQLEENNSYAQAARDTIAEESNYAKKQDVEALKREFLS